jgi:hypothetical protein
LGMERVRADEDDACPLTPERKKMRRACAETPEKDWAASASSEMPQPLGSPKALGPNRGDGQEHDEFASEMLDSESVAMPANASSVISGAPGCSRKAKPRPGTVVAITNPGSRVRKSSVVCTVTRWVDGGRIEVRMRSGELKAVDSGVLAKLRKQQKSAPRQDREHDESWLKVGSKQVLSRRVTWFGNWATGDVMAIPDGCEGCIPLPWLHEHVTIDLPPSDASLASKKLHWAMEKVTKLAVQPGLPFKVGITANPPLRWEFYDAEDCTWTDAGVTNCAKYRLDTTPAVHSKVSGDQVRELIRLSGRVSKVVESGDVDRAVNGGRWGKMVVIGISDVPEEMAQIESSIILKYGSIDACANIAPGGEGSAMMRGPPFYNYVCLGRLDE